MKALLVQPADQTAVEIEALLSECRTVSTTLAHSFSDGLNRIESDPQIEIIFVDASVKNSHGQTFAEYLKRLERFFWLPIVVTSKKWTAESVQAALQSGATDIMALPIEPEKFITRVRQLLSQGAPRILVVDDEEGIRDILQQILVLERFRVVTASRGDEAMGLIKNQKIDLVVTDIMMPGMSGLDLLGSVKSQYPEIPVILITGYPGNYSTHDTIAAGADGYFSKPFHNMALLVTVRKVLRRKRG